ncbi:YidC/Oxa1 family membrane protein insertase [Helcococcus sueciensis]|uniref:YidC/Oxa1 family membrane protein insertase n=1 Tax=Helcococcus sueciensis TaxID=241555 RepID=UPI000425D4C3|nr:YidC/Oxa1 family membrane protein insertase [Helcococcus sueciensis]
MNFLDNLLGNLFKIIYNTIDSLGIGSAALSNYAMTLIVMGLIYKLITIPFTIKNAKNAERQKQLKPELDKLQQKYGYDKQIYQQKMMEFQKEHKMMQNTGAGCLTFIIQMVIIFALYNVIRNPQNYLEGYENISRSFLWVPDLALADPTGFALPLINSLSQLGFQYLNRSTMQTAGDAGNSMMTMMYIMPIMFFFIFRNLPAGLVLYWATGNVIEIIIRLGAKLFRLGKNRG